MGVDGPQPRGGHGGPGHPAQLERLQRPDVPAGDLRRRAARRRLRRDAHAQRAAGGDHPDQGHLRHPSGPLPQRRVGGLRDLVLPHRRRHDPEPAVRQLRARGLPERPAPGGGTRDQPVPLRPRRGHRQPCRLGRAERVQLLHRRRPPAAGRLDTVRPAAAGRQPLQRLAARGDPRRVGPDRRVGGGEHARVDIRRVPAQGDLRHHRAAHAAAVLRRLRLCGRSCGRPGPRCGGLCRRRRHGRRADGAGRPRSPFPGMGKPRSGEQPAGAPPGHQGLARGRRGTRAGLRRRLLGRNVRGPGDAPLPRQRRGGGPRHLHRER